MRIDLPYGTGRLPLSLEDGRPVRVLESKPFVPGAAETVLVAHALQNPIASPTLRALAKTRDSAVLLCSDHTRPVPSRLLIPPMLQELRAGNPLLDITLLVATGCHRKATRSELELKFGPEVVQRERILQHDATDMGAMIPLGRLPSGGLLLLNRTAAEADLLLAEGFIEPHFFAGFSGGRKSVLPGVAARETVLYNHNAAFLDDPRARAGTLEGNPIHQDMEAAAELVGLQFILNVILDKDRRTVAAFAGNPKLAHRAGCEVLAQRAGVHAPPSPIVVTTNGGYPLDQNLYQCVKSLDTASRVCTDGGVIILCAACADGHGGETFFARMRDAESPAALYQEILTVAPEDTQPDQWQYQVLARVLRRCHVIVVTRPELEPTVRAMGLEYALDPDTALRLAGTRTGQRAPVTVLPDGVGVFIL